MKKIQLVLDSAHVQRLDLLCQAYGLAARDVVSQLLDGAVVALAERIKKETSDTEASDAARDQDHQAAAAASESPAAEEAAQ